MADVWRKAIGKSASRGRLCGGDFLPRRPDALVGKAFVVRHLTPTIHLPRDRQGARAIGQHRHTNDGP